MGKYVIAMDQGTTSSRCILFDEKGGICSEAQKEFRQIFPKPGWVEHDPMEIWSSQLSVTMEAMGKIGRITAILLQSELQIKEKPQLCGIRRQGACLQCHCMAVQKDR